MNKRLLVICGPTATGKTKLAIKLAKDLDGEIISADSRQVYRGMDIGTGKGILLRETTSETLIWGYAIADPREPFSVSTYLDFAREKIDEVLKRGKLPVLVGGTGFYIKGILDGIPTAHIPMNRNLREELSGKPAHELFKRLFELDPKKAEGMNNSDRLNPRRLVRAIEIAQSSEQQELDKPVFDVCVIGLTAPRELLYKNLERNVYTRVEQGMFEEVQTLLDGGVTWDIPSMSSLGYRQLRAFFEGEKTKAEAIADWILEEQKYVKRQLTWFKRDKRVQWVDITDPDFMIQVDQLVKKWENTVDYTYASKN